MIRDRLPDLIKLAQSNPKLYNEPEAHREVPLDPALKIMFERAGKVTKYISEMKLMMWELSKLQDAVIACASFKDEEECRTKITAVGNRFGAMARKSKSILKRFEIPDGEMQKYSAIRLAPSPEQKSSRDEVELMPRKIGEAAHVSWHTLSSGMLLPLSNETFIPAEVRMRFHLHNILTYKLTSLVRDYYTLQKVYGDSCKAKIKRQMSIIGREIAESELEEAIHQREQIPLLHKDIQDDAAVNREMQARLNEVEVFRREILNLEKSIGELHKSFLTISTLVHEQGAIIDRIEQHISISADYVEDSTQLLKKASIFQHKYRKKKFILAIVLAVIIFIIIIIIVVSVKKKHSGSTKVIVKPQPIAKDVYIAYKPEKSFETDLSQYFPDNSFS